MTKLTALSVAAALLGRRDERRGSAHRAEQPRPQLTELKTLREYREIVAAEFGGEKDPAKVVAKIRELRAEVKTARTPRAEQKKATIKTTVDATIKAVREGDRHGAAAQDACASGSRRARGGHELEKTETLKTLKSMSPATNLTQHAAATSAAPAPATT
jgi:hypothetical protein